jgi:hypothetical protein
VEYVARLLTFKVFQFLEFIPRLPLRLEADAPDCDDSGSI